MEGQTEVGNNVWTMFTFPKCHSWILGSAGLRFWAALAIWGREISRTLWNYILCYDNSITGYLYKGMVDKTMNSRRCGLQSCPLVPPLLRRSLMMTSPSPPLPLLTSSTSPPDHHGWGLTKATDHLVYLWTERRKYISTGLNRTTTSDDMQHHLRSTMFVYWKRYQQRQL